MLELDPKTTALILIDLQKGILSRPLSPYSADQVVAAGARLGRAVIDAGGLLVLVNVHFGDHMAAAPRGLTDQPLAVPPGGLPPDWSEIVGDVAGLPHLPITKRTWSAFFGTELDVQLRRRGIDTVIVGGVATNFGVESTARDGWHLNYNVVVAEDASTSMGDGLHAFAIEKVLPRVARVRKSEEIIDALRR
ncbi:MAG: isochorismatase family protein [Pseudolabrys sp.]|jgi:nicotinamidase-related amidase